MRIVNIIPNQNSTVTLPDWEITSPAFNVSLTNMDIYKCINQRALVYELINGRNVLITLSNIKKDLEQEALEEAEAKKTEIEKLNMIIEDLRRSIVDLKEDHTFQTMTDAQIYASSTISVVGEIISVLSDDKSKYIAYMVEPDKTLLPVSSDETTEVQTVSEKVGSLNTQVIEAVDKLATLETELKSLTDLVTLLKDKKESFNTLDEAVTFALDINLSYIGELITVNTSSGYIPYIVNSDRTISPLSIGSKITIIQ